MAAQSAVVLNTKSYAPRGKDSGNIATWALVGDTTFGGATSILSERVTGPDKDSRYKVSFKLVVPKAASEASACACPGQELDRAFVDVVVTVPAGFSAAERDDLRLRSQGLVAHAIFTAAVANLEGAW